LDQNTVNSLAKKSLAAQSKRIPVRVPLPGPAASNPSARSIERGMAGERRGSEGTRRGAPPGAPRPATVSPVRAAASDVPLPLARALFLSAPLFRRGRPVAARSRGQLRALVLMATPDRVACLLLLAPFRSGVHTAHGEYTMKPERLYAGPCTVLQDRGRPITSFELLQKNDM